MTWVLAEYECGCTWVGLRSECIEYCQNHGDDRKRMYPLPKDTDLEHGWAE